MLLLTHADAARIRAQQHLIDQQRLIVSALEGALYHFIEEQYGINLHDEHWTLNVDEGTLERVPTPPTQ